ncbi:hypothetical protein [Amycolatopsis sp. H20-H5]|uniref:hypothetical protein n=1 Tax=Amycolatopsis sp. H20-H5 TaxID=3046309 RepID=UPI002DB7EBFA|nr:hypothetical protein [Amycolatopsis sp. H20-H5]MEC3979213.1 hypothetical protein [Amycolatopsis sp. H20-H5]
MFFVPLRRLAVVLACALLAVLGVAGVPAATAQENPPAPPPYTLTTIPADLTSVQNGDPLRVTIAGLPAGATATMRLCPKNLRDSLLQLNGVSPTGELLWGPDHSLLSRVRQYCAEEFSDELTGQRSIAQLANRQRSATSGNIVFDLTVPKGSSRPAYVSYDPSYTSFDKDDVYFPWADNPVVSPGPPQLRSRLYSYSCDENNPCSLALEITSADGTGSFVTWADNSRTFTPVAPGLAVKGCAGLGPSTLTASMPERFGRTTVDWNQLLCAPTGATQPANIVSETEDSALKSFDTGASDVAITGSGSALATQTVRDRQYVPVGLNATVLAATGWSPTDRNDSGTPLISQVKDSFAMTFDELAKMLSHGGVNPDADGRAGIFHDGSPFVTRNATLGKIVSVNGNEGLNAVVRAGGSDSNNGFYGVTGEAGKGSVPLTLGASLVKSAPGSWVFPDLKAVYGDLAGKSPGVITELGNLDPTGNSQHNTDAKVGQLAVRKLVDSVMVGTGALCESGCLNWVVTDLATARAYGWTPVSLPNAAGKFVAPTESSLQAASASMKEGPDGTLLPGTATDPNAYSMTFAEYLVAPVNPLIDATCKPLQGKQDQLKTFLAMTRAGGQGKLAPGLAPLTPTLLEEALARVAKIGTGTAEKACRQKEEAQNPTPPGATGGAGTGAPGLAAPATPVTPVTNNVPAATSGVPEKTAAPSPASVLAAKNLADSVRIPSFPGAGVLGALIPLLALIILATLPSATAYLTAGRPVPPWLVRALAAVGSLFSRGRGASA